MQLEQLKIHQFRSLETTELQFSPCLNLVYGNNASGKTSLLEAIYFLGRGKSFRMQTSAPLIQQGQTSFHLHGRLSNPISKSSFSIGFHKVGAELLVKLGGERVKKLSEVAKLIPFQVISSDSHKLLEDGPDVRRRFLDWGLFHVEPQYHSDSKNYIHSLKQRNAALKAKRPKKECNIWLEKMEECGTRLNETRSTYLADLVKVINNLHETLALEEKSLGFKLLTGWNQEFPNLRDYWEAQYPQDYFHGFTGGGPHRADLLIYFGERKAKEHISRGQQKLFAILLLVSQVIQVCKQTNKTPILIIDDITAELDQTRVQCLLDLLADLPIQIFISAINPIELNLSKWRDKKLFHVEQGKLKEVV